MERRPDNLSLLVAFGVSLIVHIVLLGPVMAQMATRTPDPRAREASLESDPADLLPPEEEKPDIPLGIDEGSPSTLDWIGYEEYEEHLARLAEFNQAAFTDATTSALPAPAMTPQTQAEAQSPVETAPADAPAPDDAPVAEQVEQPRSEPTDAPPPDMSPAPTDLPLVPSIELPIQDDGFTDPLDPTPDVIPADAQPSPPEANDESDEPQESARTMSLRDLIDQIRRLAQLAQQQQPPTPPAEVPDAGQSPQVGEQADQSDRQSDAFSRITTSLDELKAGKPLAARGLDIRTQKPQFTTLVQLTAWPGNPLVRIRFGRDGLPTFAEVIESSGDKRVDDALRASLYRWRAGGEPLEALVGEQTIDIEIRINFAHRSQ
jgi:outer membrane biosynthesis protein TonB